MLFVLLYEGHYLYICRQQQQLDRVRKWLQLRNRDTDHRVQVEERRKRLDQHTKAYFFEYFYHDNRILFFKAKLDEILRREKEREHRTNTR